MKYVYLAMAFQFLSLGLMSQTISVSGHITDETGAPLPGATILEKGTQNGAISNAKGYFSLSISEDGVLIVSSVGYRPKEIPVNGRPILDVLLEERVSELDAIVVTALGIERQTRDLGYNVQRVDGGKISEVRSANFVDNLAGRLAGVTVSQGATGVGSTSKIIIRGEPSFTNNNPLFVVDGVPINNNSIVNFTNDAAAGFQEVDFGNGGMEVNSDDVASVSVLKGPGAAALYGARASNGVILISTKDGSTQQGLGVSVNSTILFERPFQLPQFQNQYGQGNSGQFEFVDGLGGGVNDNISYSWGPRLDQGLSIPQFDSPVLLSDGTLVRGGDVAVHGGLPIPATPFVSYPDNLKDFYQTGITAINNVAISSGGDKGSYRLSLTDLRSESTIPGVNLERRTVSTRLMFRPAPRLRIGTSISYNNSRSDNRPSNGYGSENVNYSLVAWGPRSLDIAAMKNYWQPGLEDVQQYSFNYTFFDNPYLILMENRNSFNRDRISGNINTTLILSDNFSLTLRSGMDYSAEQRQFRRAFSTNRFRNGAYAVHDVVFRENNTDLLLNYSEGLSDFTVDVSMGANRMDQRASTVQTQALSLAQPGIYRLSNTASPLEIFEFVNRKRINSVYGLAKLGYQDFLFVEATSRNDWSSALSTPSSSGKTSFFYPSVSAAFIVSNIFSLPNALSFLKLRASLAQVGNDTNPYQTAGAFNSSTPYSGQPTFTAQGVIPNPDLLPEKTTSIEVGAELLTFSELIRLDVSLYDATTENQIISLPVSESSGYQAKVVNGGEVRSRGVEIIAGIRPLSVGNVSWNAQVNFSRNVTTIESLPDEVERLTLAYSRIYDNVNQTVFFQVEEGGRIGDMYGTGYLRNDDGDFVIGSNGLYIADNTLKLLGNYNPDFVVGFTGEFSWKQWSTGYLFDWRQGGVLVSRTLALAAVGGQLEETAIRPESGIVAAGVQNQGTAENPRFVPNTTSVSAEAYYRNYYDRNHEENNTYNASYLKLREFTLSYAFSESLLGGSKSLKLAVIGRNLFALSEIPHFDPEQLAVQGQQFVSGVEDMSYATSRSMGLKVSLNF